MKEGKRNQGFSDLNLRLERNQDIEGRLQRRCPSDTEAGKKENSLPTRRIAKLDKA